MLFIDALSHITDTNVESNTSTGVTMTQVKKQQVTVVRERLRNHPFLVAPCPFFPMQTTLSLFPPKYAFPTIQNSFAYL